MRLLIVAAALLLTGCATMPDTIAALAKDNASVCVSVKAMLYGHLVICRSNTDGAADIQADADGSVRVQHRGRP